MNVKQLINWHTQKHTRFQGDNTPTNADSTVQLNLLISQLLNPLEKQFGELTITYGFTSFALLNYIKKNSPSHMAPEIDQHASHELNSRDNRICKRDGAACDIYVSGYENRMHIIAQYIITELPFDRLYFYGKDRPIHFSFGPEHKRYLHVKHTNSQGIRDVGKGAKASKAILLLNESI
jgi:hypothetical protein